MADESCLSEGDVKFLFDKHKLATSRFVPSVREIPRTHVMSCTSAALVSTHAWLPWSSCIEVNGNGAIGDVRNGSGGCDKSLVEKCT